MIELLLALAVASSTVAPPHPQTREEMYREAAIENGLAADRAYYKLLACRDELAEAEARKPEVVTVPVDDARPSPLLVGGVALALGIAIGAVSAAFLLSGN